MMNEEYKSLDRAVSGWYCTEFLNPHLLILVTFDSPAFEVMTDLRKIQRSRHIAPNTPMETANTYMMQRGVRTLSSDK
jgi:hypothetical protein